MKHVASVDKWILCFHQDRGCWTERFLSPCPVPTPTTQPTQATHAGALLVGLQPWGPLPRSSLPLSVPPPPTKGPQVSETHKTDVTFRIISIVLGQKDFLFFFNIFLNVISNILSLEKAILYVGSKSNL